MNLLPLLNGQNIRICDHRQGCGLPHDINNQEADVHLHKEPNKGKKFHGVIRIPLNQQPSIEVIDDINRKLSSSQRQEIRKKLLKEIEDAFEGNEVSVEQRNFVRELVDLLHKNWNDKLCSIERVKDVARRLGYAFGLEDEVESIIRKSCHEQITQYVSIYQKNQKHYFVDIRTNDIRLGEVSGRMKNFYSNK